MISKLMATTLLALGAVAATLPASALSPLTPTTQAEATKPVDATRYAQGGCFVDDGYGRRRSCAAGGVGYKKSKKKKAATR
jgi:hypothetical protein